MKPMTALVASDGSRCAQVALDLARQIHWPEGSVIHLATVVERATAAYTPTTIAAVSDPVEREVPLIGGVADDLTVIADSLGETGLKVEAHVLVGRPASAIVDEAEAVHADVIIVGSRGHGTIGSMVLGSVSAEVADHAHCPVIVARKPSWNRAILAVDGSEFSKRAEAVVAAWPIFDISQIDVVSVADTDLSWTSNYALSAYVGSTDYEANARAIAADHQRWADDATARLLGAGRRATSKMLEGDPATQLLHAAREREADLIVVGTHGRTGVRRALVGSVARNVMLHAPCSVVVVRETRPLT